MITGRVIPTSVDPTTSDAFYNDEASAEYSQPREFADITYGNVTQHIAFTNRDLRVNGVLYTAIAAARGEIGTNRWNDNKEMTLTLPIDHAIVRRYLQLGVPPQKITVTLWRRQERSGLVERMWTGEVTSMSVDDDNTEATFRVPSRDGEALQRKLPTISTGRRCPHILYDKMCQVDRNAFKVATVATSVSGRDVYLTVDTSGHLSPWGVGGELVHVATGERRTVRDVLNINPATLQIMASLQLPIPDLKQGDSIELYAGCDHTMTGVQGCAAKFANAQNYGGQLYLPTKSPFGLNAFGFYNP